MKSFQEGWVMFGSGTKAHLQKRVGSEFYTFCGVGGTEQKLADQAASRCKNCIREIEKRSRRLK